jgi:diacylglycerol kinase
MTSDHDPRSNSWASAFRHAARGVLWGIRSQRNFKVHLPIAVAVVIAAAVLRADFVEWCLLSLAITTVLAAELFNTAIEHLARAITREQHEELRFALDTASGAVLLTSAGAAAVGAVIFLRLLAAAMG